MLLVLIVTPYVFLTSCGKKGELTLKAYEKPEPPADLQAIHREQGIVLQWSYPKGREAAISDFLILKASDAAFEKHAAVDKNRRVYEEAAIEEGKDYRYKIIARSLMGVLSDDSNVITVHPLPPPPPPSELSFSIQEDSLVLAWKPAGKDIFYNVYRSLEKGKYGMWPVNSRPIAGNAFTDRFTVRNSVYYTVRSLHNSAIRGEGAASEELEIDPAGLVPLPPKNFRYHAAPDRVFLSWDEPQDSWVTRFRIYRSTDGLEYQVIGETVLPAFVDREPPLTKRDYRLHAIGPAQEGPGSMITGVIYTAPPE